MRAVAVLLQREVLAERHSIGHLVEQERYCRWRTCVEALFVRLIVDCLCRDPGIWTGKTLGLFCSLQFKALCKPCSSFQQIVQLGSTTVCKLWHELMKFEVLLMQRYRSQHIWIFVDYIMLNSKKGLGTQNSWQSACLARRKPWDQSQVCINNMVEHAYNLNTRKMNAGGQ